MGTWGRRNFDSDTAADHLSSVAGRLLAEVKAAMEGEPGELEPDEYWGVAVPCNLEILALFSEQRWVGAVVPDTETLAEWKKKFLAIYDAAELGGDPKRHAIIAATFDRLAKRAKWEAAPAPAPKKEKKKKKKDNEKKKKKTEKKKRS